MYILCFVFWKFTEEAQILLLISIVNLAKNVFLNASGHLVWWYFVLNITDGKKTSTDGWKDSGQS
jgi:hypothetical protein